MVLSFIFMSTCVKSLLFIKAYVVGEGIGKRKCYPFAFYCTSFPASFQYIFFQDKQHADIRVCENSQGKSLPKLITINDIGRPLFQGKQSRTSTAAYGPPNNKREQQKKFNRTTQTTTTYKKHKTQPLSSTRQTPWQQTLTPVSEEPALMLPGPERTEGERCATSPSINTSANGIHLFLYRVINKQLPHTSSPHITAQIESVHCQHAEVRVGISHPQTTYNQFKISQST